MPPLAEPFTHSPGFGGLCAVVAALVTVLGAALTVAQRSRADRRDEWWQRFTWLVDHAGDLSGPLIYTMLAELTCAATALRDTVLVAFAEEYSSDAYDTLPDDKDGDVP